MFLKKLVWPVAFVLCAASAIPAAAAAPKPTAVTPALVDAACKEGKVTWYTSAELELVGSIAKAFEAKYKCISVQVERSGAERNFQRLGQEYGIGIHTADVVDSSDATHFILWKNQKLLAPFVPQALVSDYDGQYRDRDGMFGMWRATLSIMGYNTSMLKPSEAPKSFADLLLPKWNGKIVKAHPGYSGTILTATYAMTRDLGWPYLEKLAKQNVLQKQSANDPPSDLGRGERPVMADGVEYLLLHEKKDGQPVAPIYPTEGSPIILGGVGIMKDAPHPNAARLYESYLYSIDAQQLIVDMGYMRSLDKHVRELAGRRPLKDIKVLKDDPAATAAHADEVKKRYADIFGV
jgi:iron(III) transport system substrate-binding protein